MRLRLFATLVPALLALAVPSAKAGEGHESKEAAAPAILEPTHEYVHSWKEMPAFTVRRLTDGTDAQIKAKPGRMVVLVFLASWCEPCQQLMPELLRLEKRYERLNTDFVYLFSHDTTDDAVGFMRQYGMTSGYLANDAALQAYKDPELPTLVLADRYGWLTGRYPRATAGQVAQVSDFLKLLTAY